MKSFSFDSLLDNRHYEECPLPLWKLKITDEEYKALKEILEQRTHFKYEGHPFKNFRKECVLFFAEYWRREYKDGKHSTKMVYDALESTMKSENFSEDFYKQAIEGAKFLGIELYAGGRIDYLDSMLYQGGLPMSLVSQNDTDSVWGRFMRGLVNKRYNFDELDLGVVATKSQSLKEYCRQMMVAIEKDEYKLMPFYCSNESDNWYISILDLSKREKIRQSHLHPFSLDWEFRVDSRERIIKTNYIIKGSRELPSAFLEEEGLSNTPSFSVLIKINGRPADSFLYQDSYCRDNVLSEKSYKFGDIVSLTIHDNDEPYITDSLDMSIPHILYKDNDGIYKLGNHIRENVSLLLFDETWKVQNENQYQIDTFKWGNVNLKGIEIEDKFDGTITLSGPDGQISFGENSPMYWTEINSNQMPTPDIEGSFYNADTCKFKLCYDTEDGVKSSNNVPVEFRSRYQDNWSDTASIGQIFVRAKSQDNRFVTPIQIVNIGTAPVINIENADQDTCDIRVSWNCGKVKTKEGTLKCDVWHIRKEDCQNPNKISFDFIPEQNSRNQFSVSVKAPFKEFAILDTDEKAISSNVWIPYIDLDKYQYHLVGQDVTYTLGEIKRKLSWYENKLYIEELGQEKKCIPYEGSLLTLFDSRENVRSLLDKTSKNMLYAQISVSFSINKTEQLSFDIKESPFVPIQTNDGKIEVQGKENSLINYPDGFKLFKLDDPFLEPKELQYNPDEEYVLPDAIRAWGETLLIGCYRGLIRPILVDLNRNMDIESRKINREKNIAAISNKLKSSSFGDESWQRIIGWFDCIQKEEIPASSLLDLSCVAQNPEYLVGLAFQLYSRTKYDEERDSLANQLISLSRDLAFQWYWLYPITNGLMKVIDCFVKDNDNLLMRHIFINWALPKGEKYIKALGDEKEYNSYFVLCISQVLSDFEKWLKKLIETSMLENYESTSDVYIDELVNNIVSKKIIYEEKNPDEYVDISQDSDSFSEPTKTFFHSYGEKNLPRNEQWMYERINAVVADMIGKENLFEQSDEIRRSIIFCSKSCNKQFIVGLNNKLINNI